MRKYNVEKLGKNRELITFEELNAKGEKIQLELTRCENSGDTHSLPYLWKKDGYTDRVLETWWSIDVYATEDEGKGACWGLYNPQEKEAEDGKRHVINFDWVFEATEENRQKLIEEVEWLAFPDKCRKKIPCCSCRYMEACTLKK